MSKEGKHHNLVPDQVGGATGGSGQGGGTTPLEKGTGGGNLGGYTRESTIIDAYPSTPAPILNIPGAPTPQNSGGTGGTDSSGGVETK